MRVDHTELQVPDRPAAAAWYRQWLGFEEVPALAEWAQTGPLMMSADGGNSLLALFAGEPTGESAVKGWRRIAYRCSAVEFRAFYERYRESGQSIEGPVDHDKSWSVYFADPWGNPLEVTTYDYAEVAQQEMEHE